MGLEALLLIVLVLMPVGAIPTWARTALRLRRPWRAEPGVDHPPVLLQTGPL